MPWWGWVSLGSMLLAAELFLVDAEFYLVFLGVAALAVGAAGLAGVDAPVWSQWLSFAVLAGAGMVFFRERIYGRIRGGAAGVKDALLDEVGTAREAIAPGAGGHAEVRGSVWNVRNAGETAIEAGARVSVERVEGLVLHVRRAD